MSLILAMLFTGCRDEDDYNVYEDFIVGSWVRGESGVWREMVTFFESDKFSGERTEIDGDGNEIVSEFLGECDYGNGKLEINYLMGRWLDGTGLYDVAVSGDELLLRKGDESYRFFRVGSGADGDLVKPGDTVIDKNLIIGRWRTDGDVYEEFEYTSGATWSYRYNGQLVVTGTYSITGNVLTSVQSDGYAEHATILELSAGVMVLYWQEDNYKERLTKIN